MFTQTVSYQSKRSDFNDIAMKLSQDQVGHNVRPG